MPMLPHHYLMMALILWLSCRIQYMFLASIPRPLGWLDPILDRMRMIRLGVHLLIRTPWYTSFRQRWKITETPNQSISGAARSGISCHTNSRNTSTAMSDAINAGDVTKVYLLPRSETNTAIVIIEIGQRLMGYLIPGVAA